MSCTHHWILETPHGATVRGTCKLCGKRRSYPSTIQDKRMRPRTSRAPKPTTSGRHTSGQGTWMRADGSYQGTNG